MLRKASAITFLALCCLQLAGCGAGSPSSPLRSPRYHGQAQNVAADEEAAAPLPGPMIEPGEGLGPGMGGDKFERLVENPFVSVQDAPLSTFSIDVDTASYSKTRMYLMQGNRLPPPDAVRIEELINYFDYEYSPPAGEEPFAVHVELADAPWRGGHWLARVAVKGREIDEQRPPGNLVFLLDVSGSMDYADKLPLVQQSMRMLVSQLGAEDRVAIVVYAGAAGMVLPPTAGHDKARILEALDRLHAGGSTNGGEGIRLAYQAAQANFIAGGVNRVILCTDGDFNVGTTSSGELVRLAAEHAREGIYLSVLGFGVGNHNDALLEQLSNEANGNYAFIDSEREARKVLGQQLNATLVTIAKDVKIQIEFNPAHVAAYRLIGYENRRLRDEEFNDDRRDAGEIGAGHAVTALYELVPAGEQEGAAQVDPLKYQTPRRLSEAAAGDELLMLKIRHKPPAGDESQLLVYPVQNGPRPFAQASRDFQFASAVAAFGMLLRSSQYRGQATFDSVLEIAHSARGEDRHGYRAEFLELVRTAQRIAGTGASASVYFAPPGRRITGRAVSFQSSRQRSTAAVVQPVGNPFESAGTLLWLAYVAFVTFSVASISVGCAVALVVTRLGRSWRSACVTKGKLQSQD